MLEVTAGTLAFAGAIVSLGGPGFPRGTVLQAHQQHTGGSQEFLDCPSSGA